MAEILIVEKWVRLIAIAGGLLVICLPLVRLWRTRDTRQGPKSKQSSSWIHWPVVFIITIIYIGIGIWLWKPISLEISPILRIILDLTGIMLYFPGIILYLWGFKALGSLFGVSTIKTAQISAHHQLIESGPYSYLRHPMYLGVISVAIGALLLFRTWAMVLFTPSAFTVILRARREEELLAQEYGNSWSDYCDRVPAWIPRIVRKEGDTSSPKRD